MPILRANPELLVNFTTANSQVESSVTTLVDGWFVESWTDGSLSARGNSSLAVRAQVLDSTGRRRYLGS